LLSTERANTRNGAGDTARSFGYRAVGLRRWLALTFLSALACVAGSWSRVEAVRDRAALAAARHENRMLLQRQEALRQRLIETSWRLGARDLGERSESEPRWREARPRDGRGST